MALSLPFGEETYQRMGVKRYLDRPLETGAKLKVKLGRGVLIDVKKCRETLAKVGKDGDAMFKCECGIIRLRTELIWWENAPFMRKR